jgi:PPOX class probable F420-dependent enzyme
MPLQGEDLRRFLEEVRLCHFATIGPDGAPRVRPLWYLYEDGAFWLTTRTEVRRTGADLVAGSPAALSIGSEDQPYRAVLAHGTPEIWEEDRGRWLERIALRYGEAQGRRWLARALKEHDRVVLRLVPDRVLAWDYGKGDHAPTGSGDRSQRVELP